MCALQNVRTLYPPETINFPRQNAWREGTVLSAINLTATVHLFCKFGGSPDLENDRLYRCVDRYAHAKHRSPMLSKHTT
jgi:hypothetical protein